jgi:hypothetical protein
MQITLPKFRVEADVVMESKLDRLSHGQRIIRIYKLKGCYDAIRVRVNFLGWQVDSELLEVFSGIVIWTVFSDIANLVGSHETNGIYKVLFNILPALSWVIIYGAVAFIHLVAILKDTPIEDLIAKLGEKENCILCHLHVRAQCMLVGFILNLCLTMSILCAVGYSLAGKLMFLFTVASFWSYRRLLDQYLRLTKKRKELLKNVKLHSS